MLYLKHVKTGDMMHNPQQIADGFDDYYSSLYNLKDGTQTTQPTIEAIHEFLDTIKIPNITPTQMTDLKSAFTPLEIEMVISSLSAHKAARPDSFPAEYYKTFSKILSPPLASIFNLAAKE